MSNVKALKKCRHLKLSVLLHRWARLCGVSASGASLERAYRQILGCDPFACHPERFQAMLMGRRYSHAIFSFLSKLQNFPQLDRLSRHPLWLALETPARELNEWLRDLEDVKLCDAMPANAVIAGLQEPDKLLRVMPEPEHLTCVLILIKCTSIHCIPRNIAYVRSAMNALAKLDLEEEWHPIIHGLNHVLHHDTSIRNVCETTMINWFSDDELDAQISQIRQLLELGRGWREFIEIDRAMRAIFFSVLTELPQQRAIEITKALIAVHNKTESEHQVQILQRLCHRILRLHFEYT